MSSADNTMGGCAVAVVLAIMIVLFIVFVVVE